MRNFFFLNLILLFFSLNFLGWGEEVVLYIGIVLFILTGIYLIDNKVYVFYIGRKLELEKGYYLIFFIKKTRLEGVLNGIYSLKILKKFYLTLLNFLGKGLEMFSKRKLLEKCGLTYM